MNQVFRMKSCLSLLLLLLFFTSNSRGFGPLTIKVDRNWIVPEATALGTLIKPVQVEGANDRSITFSLELDEFATNKENPFWIHPTTGFVYLNKSLEGRVSQPSACYSTSEYQKKFIYFFRPLNNLSS